MIDILFITDYVCPYCLVAKEALKKALIATNTDANITFHPMELRTFELLYQEADLLHKLKLH